jgi:hypothetical protein
MKPDSILQRISDSNQDVPLQSRQATGESSPAFFYAIAIAAGATASALTFTRNGAELLLLFAVALAALVILRLWTVGILLLIVQAALFAGQPLRLIDRVSLFDLVIAVSVMILLVAASRFLMIAEELSPLAGLSEAARRYLPGKIRKATDQTLTRDAREFGIAERGTGILRIILAVAGAALLLRAIPVNPNAEDEVQLIPTGLRLISLGVLMLSVFLVTDLLIEAVTWRRLSVREARVFLRSVLTSWCDRELRAVMYQEMKQRRKRR